MVTRLAKTISAWQGRVSVRTRLIAAIAIEVIYMAASRLIAANSTTLIEAELNRSPLRIAAALMFWVLMSDVIKQSHLQSVVLQSRAFITVVILTLATPLLIGGYGLPPLESIVLALASIPVAFAEELFFRGILQNLAIKRWGVAVGLATAVTLFVAFHIGVIRPDFFGYAQTALAGLILGLLYLTTGSLAIVIAVHAGYDALDSVPRMFTAPDRMWGLALLLPAAMIATFWHIKTRATASTPPQ